MTTLGTIILSVICTVLIYGAYFRLRKWLFAFFDKKGFKKGEKDSKYFIEMKL